MVNKKQGDSVTRRSFLAKITAFLGIILSYGTFFAFAVRFLYPPFLKKKRKMYLTAISAIPLGQSVVRTTPTGHKIVVIRLQDGIRVFSSRCPHLGCQVFWRPDKHDFHCPCHNGRFDQNGVAVGGPPAKEGKNLVTVPVEIEGDSIFVWV